MPFATILKTISQLRGSDKSPIQNDSEELIKTPFYPRIQFTIKLVDDRPGENCDLIETAGMKHASNALSRDCCESCYLQQKSGTDFSVYIT